VDKIVAFMQPDGVHTKLHFNVDVEATMAYDTTFRRRQDHPVA